MTNSGPFSSAGTKTGNESVLLPDSGPVAASGPIIGNRQRLLIIEGFPDGIVYALIYGTMSRDLMPFLRSSS